MGEANEKRNIVNMSSTGDSSSIDRSSSSRIKMESLSLEISKYPRDLLQRFNFSSSKKKEEEEEGEEEEEEEDSEEEGIELKLGLSLGGKFGVDKTSSRSAYSSFKKKKKKLTRSSSIAGSIPFIGENEGFPFGGVKVMAAAASYHQQQQQQQRPVLMRTASLPAETEEAWRKRKEMQSLRRLEAKRRRSEKQLRSSCGAFEFERSSASGDSRIAASIPSFQERINQEAAGSSVTKTNESLNRTSRAEMDNPSNRGNEIGMNSMEDMPCVFTKGEGPNGRRVDGILYKYGRGEEVRIMCVCHGTFHSPAEFVKHAGGGDVDHPLRHIVVNPAGPSL